MPKGALWLPETEVRVRLMENILGHAFGELMRGLVLSRTDVDEINRVTKKVGEDIRRIFAPSVGTEASQPPSIPMPFAGMHPFGSVTRGTSVQPFSDVDVDLLVAFVSHPAHIMMVYPDNRAFLRAFQEALRPLGGESKVYEGQCIRLTFDRPPSIDVFAAFDLWDLHKDFWFPHGEPNHWFRSNPVMVDRFILQRNRELGGYLLRVLRGLKAWNRHRRVGFRGYHLELLAALTFKQLTANWVLEMWSFFRLAAIGDRSFFATPSPDGFVQDLSLYLTDADITRIGAECRWAYDEAGAAFRAHQVGDHRTALTKFHGVFGDPFPLQPSLAT
ncbi:MAG TPA: hypothetical protein DCF65_12035 [Chloroflexi bacterium]|nr:hypothetical protein [Chloroflexota bacterium]HAF20606.1 hypothetical protein [Chloroflexota bacterium]